MIESPVGGGAIRGIDEKVGVSTATGSATLAIPIPLPAGRSRIDPSLTLAYNSGGGDGPFGLGWSLDVPSVRRRTDTGVPRYLDPTDERTPDSDVFVLGGEDLVAVLDGDAPRRDPRRLHGTDYVVCAYRPRTEGTFTRVERWTEVESGRSHWRSIDRENVVTVYGTSDASRVHDPGAEARTSTWHIDWRADDRGNVTVFRWLREDGRGVDAGRASERHRPAASREVERHLGSVHWGNRQPYEPDWGEEGAQAALPQEWMFSAVLDYGDHAGETPGSAPDRDWDVRPDPYSSYRTGFEVRSYRRCRRVLVYHHFPDEPGVGADCLVRSVALTYADDGALPGAEPPALSLLQSATARGHRRTPAGGYTTRSLPPVEFDYTTATLSAEVVEVDAEAVGGLPSGLAGQGRRWTDLDGDGVSGVLTVDRGEVSFARNLSPAAARPPGAPAAGPWFEPRRGLADVPSLVAGGRPFDVWDVDHDGRPELVSLEEPARGFHERDGESWSAFRPFAALPSTRTLRQDGRLVDLTGDGAADVVAVDGPDLRVHPGLGSEGFGETVTTVAARDGDGSVADALASPAALLADMSGDGLSDVVVVEPRRVSYWPNLGWGRFGDRVVMEGSPLAAVDGFDPSRVRLADTDGTGTADLVYLGADGVTVARNLAGNAWGAPALLEVFPPAGAHREVEVVDLLGTGTSCLAWSSTAPGEAGARLRYVHLVPHKPHLLARVRNNLGAETRIGWAPSTRFATEDRLAGRPWSTRLPMPVHVVERVERLDLVARTRFVTRYAYHHGHYDGVDREFRGFGMVETWDTETRADGVAALLADAEATNWDAASHVPPVWTRTWFHTGAYADREHVSTVHAGEYWLEPGTRDEPARLAAALLPDTVVNAGLDEATAREACRALRGVELRSEVFALDATPASAHPYTVTERDYTVRVLQPATRGHAVCLAVPREALTTHYERDPADPRVSSQVTLEVDEWGNPLREVEVTYPRRPGHAPPEPDLPAAHRQMLAHDQSRLTVLATARSYTNPVEEPDAYRLPLVAETLSAELLGVAPPAQRPGLTARFTFDELDDAWQTAFAAAEPPESVTAADVTGQPEAPGPLRHRVLARTRTRYRRDDLAALLPLGQVGRVAATGRTDRLALPATQVTAIFGGDVSDADLQAAGYVRHGDGPDWWIPGGRVYFTADPEPAAVELTEARTHFWQPRRSVDAFGNTDRVAYDAYDLTSVETVDAVGNRTTATVDYRVVQPVSVTDPNGDRSLAAYDALGHVAATALAGRQGEDLGDALDGVEPDLPPAAVAAFLADPDGEAVGLLGAATARVVSDPAAFLRTRDDPDPTPAWSATIRREQHGSDLAPGAEPSVQLGFTHADGLGREIQTKSRAEPGPLGDQPGPVDRWICSGWTVHDNKGQPVETFEPSFTATPRFEFDRRAGVSTTCFYDPLGRQIGCLHPDATLERVDIDAWRRLEWDRCDLSLIDDPTADPVIGRHMQRLLAARGEAFVSWHDRRSDGTLGADAAERQANHAAAEQSAAHAGTPVAMHVDAAGLEVLTVTDDGAGGRHATRTARDGGGRTLAVVDALSRTVQQQLLDAPAGGGWIAGSDLAGRTLTAADLDSGRERLLPDAADELVRRWDGRGRRLRVVRDANRRVTHRWLSVDGAAEVLLERLFWGDDLAGAAHPDDGRRLRGRMWRAFGQAGMTGNDTFDFKGNLLSTTTALARTYTADPDWSPLAGDLDAAGVAAAAAPLLDAQSRFTGQSRYDALDRPVRVTTPHGPGLEPHTMRSRYNRAGLLEAVDLWVGDAAPPSDPATADHHVLVASEHNARRQPTRLEYGNGTRMVTEYDPLTFRPHRIATLRDGPGGVEALQDLRYTYDAAGNVTNMADASEPTLFYAGAVVEATATYAYDALYRLVEASGREHLGSNGGVPLPPARPGPGGAPRVPHPADGQAMGRYTQRYAYDAAGNLLRVSHQTAAGGWVRRYAYDEPSRIDAAARGNRLGATSRPGDPDGGPYTATYAYDEHGNTVRMPHLPGLSWDPGDRLRSSTGQVRADGTPETTYYLHDQGGARVRKVTDSEADPGEQPRRLSERVYLGELVELYREFGPDGSVTLRRETVHVRAGDQRMALLERRTAGDDPGPAELLRYQQADHLGSAVLELDDGGGVIAHESYHPFGTTAHRAARNLLEAPNRYRFTGHERDEETGLSHHGARYYAAWLGRWASPDPAGLVDGPNRYAYVNNNPVRLVDPSGTGGEESFADLNDVVEDLNKDPVVADKLTDKRAPLARRKEPWTSGKKGTARKHADKQAAAHRKQRGMKGRVVQAGHTAAAGDAPESGITKADWDTQPMMELHSRKDKDLAVHVTEPDGTTKVRTRHTGQEGLRYDAVGQSRKANGGKLDPQGQLDAAEQVKWQTENTPWDQRDVDKVRQSGPASGGGKSSPSKAPAATPPKATPKPSAKPDRMSRMLAKLGKASKNAAKAIPFLGIGVAQASAAHSASQGDYAGAVLDEVGMIPGFGDVVDTGRAAFAFGGALDEGLGVSEVATLDGTSAENAAKALGASEDTAQVVGAVTAGFSSVTTAPSRAAAHRIKDAWNYVWD